MAADEPQPCPCIILWSLSHLKFNISEADCQVAAAKYVVLEKQGKKVQIDRQACLEVVTNAIAKTYFPNGSSASGKKLSMVDYYLARADGTRLPATIEDEEFTLSKYRTTQTSPLRLYLFTMDKVGIIVFSFRKIICNQLLELEGQQLHRVHMLI